MEAKILDLIKAVTNTFFITKVEENKSILMLVFPYKPFELLNKKEYATLDAYYFISNESYHKTKELIVKLNELGINANYNFNLNYKKLAKDSGFSGIGKNTLAYINSCGSRFVMQAVELTGNYDYKMENTVLQPNCKECNLCKNACPTGAIKDDGFDFKKCLRYLQECGEYLSDEISKKMQNKLLGCDICQAVCPYNKNEKRIPVDEELKEFLKLENLLEIMQNAENLKKKFTSKIGKNYAREKIILPNLMLVAGNSNNRDLVNKLKFFTTHSNDLIQKNAIRSTHILLDDKNH